MTTACTQGAHHIGLAVRDVAEARDFFVEALGFRVAAERPDYPAIFVTDGTTLLTWWQVAEPAGAAPFDRRANIGLHHLALRVADLDALRTVFARVQNHPGMPSNSIPNRSARVRRRTISSARCREASASNSRPPSPERKTDVPTSVAPVRP